MKVFRLKSIYPEEEINPKLFLTITLSELRKVKNQLRNNKALNDFFRQHLIIEITVLHNQAVVFSRILSGVEL